MGRCPDFLGKRLRLLVNPEIDAYYENVQQSTRNFLGWRKFATLRFRTKLGLLKHVHVAEIRHRQVGQIEAGRVPN
jgi:hypothetical protein